MPELVGSRVPRLDGPDKVSGRARYTATLTWPGLAVGRILRSPYPHARVLAVDTARAMALPGVYGVLTGRDTADGLCRPFYGPLIEDKPVVATDRVRFVGDPVAAVAACDDATAREAVALIQVEYEPLPYVTDVLEAIRPEAPALHEVRPRSSVTKGFGDLDRLDLGARGNVISHFRLRRGDPEKGMRQAARVYEETFRSQTAQHVAMEPHACVASWSAGGELEVWSGTQHPYTVRRQLAEIFSLPLSRVRVRVPYVGGGFGSKSWVKIEPICAALAKKTGRPVKLVLDRDEVFLTLTKHAAVVRLRCGVDEDGRFVACESEIFWDTGAYADNGPRVGKNGGLVSPGPYRIPHVKVDAYTVCTNKPSAGGFRGYGVSQVCWAHEQMLDIIAADLGTDPVDLRLRNAVRDGDPFHTGEILRGVGVTDALRAVAERLGWQGGGRPREIEPGVIRGTGFATFIKSTATPAASEAAIKLEDDGSASLACSSVEIGQGAETVMLQLAGDVLGLPLERLRIRQPDTALTPWDHATSSSASTFRMGRAVVLAAEDLRGQLLRLAAEALEAAPDDLEIADGMIRLRGSPGREVGFSELVRRAHGGLQAGTLSGHGTYCTEGGLDPATGQGIASSFWETGALGCEVDVDLGTGEIRPVRIVVAADVGRAVNPSLCEGQLQGGVVMGLGLTLLEEMVFADGQCVNPNLTDYAVPTVRDVPRQIETILIEHPHPDGPFGAHGVGEAGVLPVAPAIANAVCHASGVRLRSLPLRAHHLLEKLGDLGAEGRSGPGGGRHEGGRDRRG